MPRKKPPGWPRYMEAKPTKKGISYYWNVPTWARKREAPFANEALGSDYADAKRRCDELLNPQLDAWRTGEGLHAEGPSVGTVDWMFSIFRESPQYNENITQKTRESYEYGMQIASDYKLQDGRLFGRMYLNSITPGVADKLFANLKYKKDGSDRTRTAVHVVVACKRAWNIAWRNQSAIVPALNPFRKMGIHYKAKPTRPVTYDEMMALVDAADKSGQMSIGTAAMIAFFWLQREEDILDRLSWNHYRPNDAPDIARIFHHKTGELVEIPLYDEDGTELWPELVHRLDNLPRYGTLIVTRETVDRKRKVRLPWGHDHFRHRVKELKDQLGWGAEMKFMGLRHGGNTEAAEAGLTDAQLRALSGHKTTAALIRYAQATKKQRRIAARKRLDARTKKGNVSE